MYSLFPLLCSAPILDLPDGTNPYGPLLSEPQVPLLLQYVSIFFFLSLFLFVSPTVLTSSKNPFLSPPQSS